MVWALPSSTSLAPLIIRTYSAEGDLVAGEDTRV